MSRSHRRRGGGHKLSPVRMNGEQIRDVESTVYLGTNVDKETKENVEQGEKKDIRVSQSCFMASN